MKKLALIIALAVFTTAYVESVKAETGSEPSLNKAHAVHVAKKKKKKKKKPEEVVAVPAATPAPAVESAKAPEASASSGQTATSAPEAPAAEKPRKFSVWISEWSEASTYEANRGTSQNDGSPAASLSPGGTGMDGLLTIRARYKPTDTMTVYLGDDIDHSFGAQYTPKKNGDPNTVWSPEDIYLGVSSKLGTVPGGVNASGYLRFYAPTSQVSQDSGQIGRFRANLELKKPFGKFAVLYDLQPRYYMQQNNYYFDHGSNKITATNNTWLLHFVGATYDFTDKLSVYSNAGIMHRWYNRDSSVNIQANTDATRQDVYTETGVGYEFNKTITLTVGYWQFGPNLLALDRSVSTAGAMYNENYSQYFLETDITL